MANDYVSEILQGVSGLSDEDAETAGYGYDDDETAGEDDETAGIEDVGLDDITEDYIDRQIAGLVEVGALTEVGRRKAKKAMRRGILAGRGQSSFKPIQPIKRTGSPQNGRLTRGATSANQQQSAAAQAPNPNQATNNPSQQPQQSSQAQQRRGAPMSQDQAQFSRSGRDIDRRAPLGFSEDGTGHNYFTLAAAIGATATMRAKVSRPSHVDRLLIVPTAPGAVIESIRVGDEEQALASGVPVELYGPSALTDTLTDNFSPLGSGIDFIVVLRNTTSQQITGTIGTKCAVRR